jgi:glycosyltransferase involved in cell wall biosynthesis
MQGPRTVGGNPGIPASLAMRLRSEQPETASHQDDRGLAVVLWSGHVGGAETLNISLAQSLRRLGLNITVVFVQEPWPLARRLSSIDIPYATVGVARGRDVLRQSRRYAAAVADAGPDGALLLERGFMGATLRAGGYREPIVSVEHGMLIGLERRSRARRLFWKLDQMSGAWAADAQVAVSDFMLDHMHRHPHARHPRRIYNGVDPDAYTYTTTTINAQRDHLVVGFVGRLAPGKGADRLIEAFAWVSERLSAKLLIAGDGPERPRLEVMAGELDAGSAIDFLGIIDDPATFWRRCDIAVVPSEILESFSMVTLEAMACGKPVVATNSGAIPELVFDGTTGMLVPPGDAGALARALVTYGEDPKLRIEHGIAARARAVASFHIDDCARAYARLFEELWARRRP